MEKMDSQIWSRLPSELLDYILAFLPLKSLFNLRTTCKRFNSLFFSPSFISSHASLSSSSLSSFLLLSHPQFLHHFPLFDTFVSNWRLLSISLSLPPSCSAASPTHLLSASNGLLCFSIPSSFCFLICNFLSRSSKLIPFPSYPLSFYSVTLIPSSSSSSSNGGYQIFILCSGYFSNSVFLYNSGSSSWSQFSGFEPILRQNSHQEGVLSNGYVNFTTPEPFSVVGFNLESGKWEIRMDELPGELTFVRLVSSGEGKLYLIGGIGIHGISRGMKLWKEERAEGGRDRWVEIGRLPELMSKKFMSVCYHNYDHVYCFYHEGLICVCCYNWPEVLYYKIVRRTWHWIPKCPSLPEKWSCGFRWFSFVPNLRALV